MQPSLEHEETRVRMEVAAREQREDRVAKRVKHRELTLLRVLRDRLPVDVEHRCRAEHRPDVWCGALRPSRRVVQHDHLHMDVQEDGV